MAGLDLDLPDGPVYVGEVGSEVDDVLLMLDKAIDSREMSVAVQKELFKSAYLMMKRGKMGAGDVVKFLGMVNDRVDGKVSERVEVNVTHSDEAIDAVRELVRSGVIGLEDGRNELRLLGINEVEILDE